MIDPERFYASSDEPSAAARRRIWRSVDSRIRPEHASWLVLERKSFLLGAAASVIILLAGIGGLSAMQRLLDGARPPALRVDNAYRSAIREFEGLTVRGSHASDLEPSTTAITGSQREVLQSRREELLSLDAGIESLRSDLQAGDLSPVKRARLRDLYSKKLMVLLEMIEQGEITL